MKFEIEIDKKQHLQWLAYIYSVKIKNETIDMRQYIVVDDYKANKKLIKKLIKDMINNILEKQINKTKLEDLVK